MFIICITAWIIHKQVKENIDWNRRKTSQEILNHLTTGEYAAIRTELYEKLGCDFSDVCQTYSKLKCEKDEDDNKRLTLKLAKFFNILEVICINLVVA